MYAIVILSPLVMGMTYATAARVASYAPEGWMLSGEFAWAATTLAAVVLLCLSLSRVSAELYHLRRPESVTDALPVGTATHLHASLLKRIARTSATAVVVLVARSFLNEAEATPGVSVVAPLAVFVGLASLAATLAALEWIHWGHVRDLWQAVAGVVVLLPTLALAGVLLLLVLKPALLPAAWNGAGGVWLVLGGCALWCAALYALVRSLHGRWRASDIEYATRLQASGGRSMFKAGFLRRAGSASVAAQVARDLQLTLRAFSSAVYVALLVAVLSTAFLLTALTTGMLPASEMLPPGTGGGSWIEATWLLPLVASKVTCVVVVLSLASILPVLVAYQLPHRWLERAAGTTGAEMWRAKLWYARLLTLPAPFVVWAASCASGVVPVFYALALLAECLWIWWLVSGLAGSLAFEVPEQPGLAIILMLFAGLSGGLLTAWLWPLGLLAGLAISQMSERAPHRAHYLLATEED